MTIKKLCRRQLRGLATIHEESILPMFSNIAIPSETQITFHLVKCSYCMVAVCDVQKFCYVSKKQKIFFRLFANFGVKHFGGGAERSNQKNCHKFF